MKVENIVTTPIQKTYKYGVYGSLGFVGISLTAFVLWSFACFGSACIEWVGGLA